MVRRLERYDGFAVAGTSSRHYLVGYSFLDPQPMQRLQGRSDLLMTFDVCYHVAKSILDELETAEFSLRQTYLEQDG